MRAISMHDESCVSSYFSSIKGFKLLSPDDEISLASRKGADSAKAREQLVKSNLRLVIKIAKGYIHFEPSLIDLIQEGNMGLIKAAEKFDPSMGCRFSTYASYWIKHYIARFIAKAGRSIRIPIRKTDLFKKMQVEKDHFINEHGTEPSARDLALILGVEERDILDLQEYFQPMMSLESPLNCDDLNLHDVVGDDSSHAPESIFARKELSV
ncbi:MAG: sigma-70 family RNA polymerase sigma factor, partial [Spirochaetota bacterium]